VFDFPFFYCIVLDIELYLASMFKCSRIDFFGISCEQFFFLNK